jgi:hypothetical protein
VQQDAEGQEDDLDVAPDRPMLEILQISLEPVAQIVLVQRRTAIAANLRKAGQAGLGRMAMPVSLVDFPEQLVGRARAKCVRARADDAHVALEDVQQLRQFVDAGTADDLADARDPIVVARRRARTCAVAVVNAHAAELHQAEHLVAATDPDLAEEDRAARIDLHRQRDQDPDRHERHQRAASEYHVEAAFYEAVEQD